MGFRFRKKHPDRQTLPDQPQQIRRRIQLGSKRRTVQNRTTLSVPGTGISYTTESKAHTSKEKPSKKKNVDQAAASAKQQVQQTAGAQNPAYQQRTNEKLTQHHFVQNHISGFVLDHCDSHLADFLIHLVFEDRQHKKAQQDRKDLSTGSLLDRFLHHRRNRGYAKRAGDIQLSDPISKITSKASPAPTASSEPTPTPRAVSDAGADKHACSRNGQAACSTIASTARYTKQQRHAGKHFRFRRTNRTSARK